MKNTQKFWIIIIGFATLLVGSWIGYKQAQMEFTTQIDDSVDQVNQSYYIGWNMAMDEFVIILEEQSKDTNTVKKLNFIFSTDSLQIFSKFDTITYYIYQGTILKK